MSLDWSALLSDKTKAGRQDYKKRIFHALSSQGRFSAVPSSALLCAGNLVNIRSTPEVIVDSSISRAWTPQAIFLSDRNDPLWECWYNRLKKWLPAPPPLLSLHGGVSILTFCYANEVIVLLCADWSRAKPIVGDRKKIRQFSYVYRRDVVVLVID